MTESMAEEWEKWIAQEKTNIEAVEDRLEELSLKLKTTTNFQYKTFWDEANEIPALIESLSPLPPNDKDRLMDEYDRVCKGMKRKQEQEWQARKGQSQENRIAIENKIQEALTYAEGAGDDTQALTKAQAMLKEAITWLKDKGENDSASTEPIPSGSVLMREDQQSCWDKWRAANDLVFNSRQSIWDSGYEQVIPKAKAALEEATNGDSFHTLEMVKAVQIELKEISLNRTQREEIRGILNDAWEVAIAKVNEIRGEKKRRYEEWLGHMESDLAEMTTQYDQNEQARAKCLEEIEELKEGIQSARAKEVGDKLREQIAEKRDKMKKFERSNMQLEEKIAKAKERLENQSSSPKERRPNRPIKTKPLFSGNEDVQPQPAPEPEIEVPSTSSTDVAETPATVSEDVQTESAPEPETDVPSTSSAGEDETPVTDSEDVQAQPALEPEIEVPSTSSSDKAETPVTDSEDIQSQPTLEPETEAETPVTDSEDVQAQPAPESETEVPSTNSSDEAETPATVSEDVQAEPASEPETEAPSTSSVDEAEALTDDITEVLKTQLKWIGHSAFLITASDGTSILTDPFGTYDGLNYEPINESADIVLTSHFHGDHYGGDVTGDPRKISLTGVTKVKGIDFNGIASFHDSENGSQRGSNTIFCFTIDGINICHLGDLGHVLSDDQVSQIGQTDILLIPVGGFFTIDASEASQVCDQINPKVIIPMHVSNDKCAFPISKVDDFINGKSNVQHINGSQKEFDKEGLPATNIILVLQAAN